MPSCFKLPIKVLQALWLRPICALSHAALVWVAYQRTGGDEDLAHLCLLSRAKLVEANPSREFHCCGMVPLVQLGRLGRTGATCGLVEAVVYSQAPVEP